MMETDTNDPNGATESNDKPRPSPVLMLAIVMWFVCLAGIVFGWYQWRLNQIARFELAASNTKSPSSDSDDDGRSVKSIKLIPQKDGTFSAREVTKEEEESPWNSDGIEDFSFTSADGQSITKQDLLGKPFIISFIFTYCRGPCPNVTKEMRELQDRLKDYDFNLVSLTVDPVRDTVEVLNTYGKEQGADSNRWKFLTGDQTEIYGLIQRSFLMPVDEAVDKDRKPGFEIIHSTNIMLVDKTGRVIGKFNATRSEDMSKLRKEIKRIAVLRTGAVGEVE